MERKKGGEDVSRENANPGNKCLITTVSFQYNAGQIHSGRKNNPVLFPAVQEDKRDFRTGGVRTMPILLEKIWEESIRATPPPPRGLAGFADTISTS